MSATEFFLVCAFVFFVFVGGVVYYLKRRGVLRAAANAAKQAVATDVQNVANKVDPPKAS